MLMMDVSRLMLLLWFSLAHVGALLVSGQSKEYFLAKQSLIENLTNNSSVIKEILPVVDQSSPVVLSVEVVLHQISTVDEVNQAIRLNVWLRLYWNNPFVQWDPKEYQGIESVHLDNDHFWTPDISLFNQASLEEEIDVLYKRLTTKVIVYYNGNFTWKAPATLLSQCRIDVSRFPFDEQDCDVIFGSWTYSEKEINITHKNERAHLDKFIKNGEWEVVSAFFVRKVETYGPNKIPYPDVTFHLHIKRRPLYYGINLLVPCALIALLSFISFILPSDHGERVSLVITVLLANSVYMIIISSSLPQTSDAVPVIAIYFICIIVEISLCLFATCLTVKIHGKTSEIPVWFDTLVNKYLAWLVSRKCKEKSIHEKENGIVSVVHNEKFTKIELDGDKRVCLGTANGRDSNQQDLELVETGFLSNGEEEWCEELGGKKSDLLSEIRLLADEVRLKQSKDIHSKKWMKAASILDRFFLIVFLIIYLILTGYLLGSM